MEVRELRFRSWLFPLVLLVLSIAGSFLVVNVQGDFPDNYDNLRYLDGIVYSLVGPRLVVEDADPEYRVNNKEGLIEYASVRTSIANYPFTKDFKKRHPNTIVGQDEHGELYYFNSKSDYDAEKKNIKLVKTNIDKLEEAKKIKILDTNSQDSRITIDSSPYEISKEISGENLVVLRAKGKNVNLTIEDNIDDFSDREQRIGMYIKSKISDMIFLDERYNTTEEDFFYTVDLNNPIIKKGYEYSKYTQEYVIKVTIASIGVALLSVIYLSFINYQKAEKFNTLNWLSNFPVEIYGLIVTGIVISYDLFNSAFNSRGYSIFKTYQTFVETPYYKYGIAFYFIVLIGLLASYFLWLIKSLYHDGFKSFLFNKSIIFRILRMIYQLIAYVIGKIKKFFIFVFSAFSPGSLAFAIGLYLLGTLLCIVISVAFHWSGYFFILLFGLMNLGFFLVRKYIFDFREIEDVSSKIAQGDFNTKIDEANNLFKKLAHNLNITGDSLDLAIGKELRAERMRTELITNVSHDLKTPLTSIINYSELASAEDASQDDIKKYNKVINEKAHRLKDLIENLFEVSKATTKNIDLNMMELDFAQMVNQIAGEWTDKFSEKNLSIVSQGAGEPVKLKLDGQQTSRILDNVFSNIYKYALEGTRVYMDLIEDDKQVNLRVKNISKYPLNISADELLERFTRGDASRSTEGSGLGLSIASSLTELQGGEFKIEILGDLFMVELEFNK